MSPLLSLFQINGQIKITLVLLNLLVPVGRWGLSQGEEESAGESSALLTGCAEILKHGHFVYAPGWWKLFPSDAMVCSLMRSEPAVWAVLVAWHDAAPPLGSPCSRTSLPCTTEQDKGSLPEMSVLHLCAQHCVKLPNQRMRLSPFQSGRAASWPCSRMKPSVWKYHLLGEPYLVFIDVFNFYSAN